MLEKFHSVRLISQNLLAQYAPMESKQTTVMVCDNEADLLKVYATALKKHYNVLNAATLVGPA
jgi:hypothetical protein